jgi:two-component system nitrate/nitrite response regulator NarL
MTRVLIADDHPLMLSGIESVLRGSDFEVAARARDGTAALAAVESDDPDIVVLDVKMPGLTGLDVLRALRHRGDRRPVVLLTASIEDEELVEAMKLGVQGVIMKEDAETLIRACLEKVRGGERWIQPSVYQRALDAALDEGRPRGRFASLAPRERAIARLVRAGMRNREIADELGLTEGTVKVCLHRMYDKLGVANRTELAMLGPDVGD